MRVAVETQAKAVHVLAGKIPDHMIGLFAEPALLKGEDPKLYWNIVSATIDEHRPQGLLDWIAIVDLVTKLWEERLLRRTTNAIIRAGQRHAVEQFLTEIRPGADRLKFSGNKAERQANKYFSGNKKESGDVQSELAEFEITEAEVLARSTQNNIDALVTLDRMLSLRERGRRRLQKEMRRRLPSQEVKSKSQGDVAASRLGPRQEVNTEAKDNSKAHHHDCPELSRELEKASTGGKLIHQTAQCGSCQEVKAEGDRDGDKHHLDQPGPCQEVMFEMVDEADTHHYGH